MQMKVRFLMRLRGGEKFNMQTKIKLGKSKPVSSLKLPFDFFENHFRLLSANTVKIYMYLMYLCSLGEVEISEEDIAKKLSLDTSSVKECYIELEEYGLISLNDNTNDFELVNLEEFYKNYFKMGSKEVKKEIKDKSKSIKFDEDFKKKIGFIEDVYGKDLNQNDILEIYDLLTNYKIPYDVLICAIEYSASKNKKSFNYISKVALNWKELGLNSYESCEKYITDENLDSDKLFNNVKKIFGLKRELFDVEKTFIEDWYYNKHKTLDDIKKAFESTILNTGKLSFPYLNKVLTNDKTVELKRGSKNIGLNNFKQREYDSKDVLNALRKKQNS